MKRANAFFQDILTDDMLQVKLRHHFNGQPFDVFDLVAAANAHGYTFSVDDFRYAWDSDGLRQQHVGKVLRDELDWQEPSWLG